VSVRLFLALLLLVGAGVAYAFREPILFQLGNYLVADEPRRPADAIVVLAGSTPDRVLEAVDLYRQGLAPRIVLTQGNDSPGIEELRRRGGEMLEPHEQNRAIAMQLGVPASAIEIVQGGAGGTVTEAHVVVDHLRRIAAKSALIVTSKIHTRRSGWIYRGVAGDEIAITTCASHYDSYDPASWWRHRGHTRRVVIEYQKLLVYWVRDSWRLG
jgi:uncharacterized SAM-binding protein YcdF (DUF218 family)